MKIDRIILNNFGSYENEIVFDTRSVDDRNIILIGGKNGAGKTTLFTAIRVCLYGHMSMGYRNQNSYYHRAITKLINNNAKLSRPAKASVKIHMAMSNGHELDEYILERNWVLADTLVEEFSVTKNGAHLSESEIADFEKYLLSLIPPELFNLYFFDGEKVADFFLNEGSNTRIREAFLTLCKYDTFDIMRKNFRRISMGTAGSSPELDEYVQAKENVSELERTQALLVSELEQCTNDIDACESDIVALEKEYSQQGGITQEELNDKLYALRDEERKRESWNAWLRKCANEMIPFLIIRDQILSLKTQIEAENDNAKYRIFSEMLEIPAIREVLGQKRGRVQRIARELFGSDTKQILELSLEQSASLLAQINTVLSFDQTKVARCKNLIKKSIAYSSEIRAELDRSSVSAVQEYMQRRSELFERKSELLQKKVELERQVSEQKEKLQQALSALTKIRAKLENELKQASLHDISAKSIIMLDRLQQILYRKQLEKVEAYFRERIGTLMRKTDFIDDIHIDDDFTVHIYRTDRMSVSQILESMRTNNESQFVALFGKAALLKLKEMSKQEGYDEVLAYYSAIGDGIIELPVEIDKAVLSNGEKQIFIMALYHSLVQLCTHEIPFIIDTPFARIDTEHRKNISQHFFCKLKGQVFILSTNEEVDSEHVQIMRDKMLVTYMLENSDNKRTTVVKNSYFEV